MRMKYSVYTLCLLAAYMAVFLATCPATAQEPPIISESGQFSLLSGIKYLMAKLRIVPEPQEEVSSSPLRVPERSSLDSQIQSRLAGELISAVGRSVEDFSSVLLKSEESTCTSLATSAVEEFMTMAGSQVASLCVDEEHQATDFCISHRRMPTVSLLMVLSKLNMDPMEIALSHIEMCSGSKFDIVNNLLILGYHTFSQEEDSRPSTVGSQMLRQLSSYCSNKEIRSTKECAMAEEQPYLTQIGLLVHSKPWAVGGEGYWHPDSWPTLPRSLPFMGLFQLTMEGSSSDPSVGVDPLPFETVVSNDDSQNIPDYSFVEEAPSDEEEVLSDDEISESSESLPSIDLPSGSDSNSDAEVFFPSASVKYSLQGGRGGAAESEGSESSGGRGRVSGYRLHRHGHGSWGKTREQMDDLVKDWLDAKQRQQGYDTDRSITRMDRRHLAERRVKPVDGDGSGGDPTIDFARKYADLVRQWRQNKSPEDAARIRDLIDQMRNSRERSGFGMPHARLPGGRHLLSQADSGGFLTPEERIHELQKIRGDPEKLQKLRDRFRGVDLRHLTRHHLNRVQRDSVQVDPQVSPEAVEMDEYRHLVQRLKSGQATPEDKMKLKEWRLKARLPHSVDLTRHLHHRHLLHTHEDEKEASVDLPWVRGSADFAKLLNGRKGLNGRSPLETEKLNRLLRHARLAGATLGSPGKWLPHTRIPHRTLLRHFDGESGQTWQVAEDEEEEKEGSHGREEEEETEKESSHGHEEDTDEDEEEEHKRRFHLRGHKSRGLHCGHHKKHHGSHGSNTNAHSEREGERVFSEENESVHGRFFNLQPFPSDDKLETLTNDESSGAEASWLGRSIDSSDPISELLSTGVMDSASGASEGGPFVSEMKNNVEMVDVMPAVDEAGHSEPGDGSWLPVDSVN